LLCRDAVHGYFRDENESDGRVIDIAARALERLGYWVCDDD
jgi:hypothetical protein